MSNEVEEWRPCVGYEEFYAVSNWGRVKRVKKGTHTQPGRLLKLLSRSNRYSEVWFSLGSYQSRRKVIVHHLVAAAFLGPRPDGMSINHIDGVKIHNGASNLEYTTPQGNMDHAVEMGLVLRGEDHSQAKLKDEQVRKIRHLLISTKLTHLQIADQFDVHKSTISLISRGRIWKHVA